MDPQVLARYNTREEAARYNQKFERRLTERVTNWHEQALVRRILSEIAPGGSALDVPCGAGRLFPLLRARFDRVFEADWGFDMVRQARANHQAAQRDAAGFVRLTALALPFKDRSIDVVFSARLSHHIRELDERRRHVSEALRVARRAVVVTYFAHESLKAKMRRMYRFLGSRKREKWTLKTDEVAALAKEHGFTLVASWPISRLFSGHRYALLVRGG